MRIPGIQNLPVRLCLISTISLLLLLQQPLLGQASYQAQIRGIVSDAAGAVLPHVIFANFAKRESKSHPDSADRRTSNNRGISERSRIFSTVSRRGTSAGRNRQ